jgi:hypothetical protein
MKKTLFFSKGDGKKAFIQALYATGRLPHDRKPFPHEVDQALKAGGYPSGKKGEWVRISDSFDENVVYACGTGQSKEIINHIWLYMMQIEGDNPLQWIMTDVDLQANQKGFYH